MEMPVKSDGDKIVRFRDSATAMRSFKDPTSIARINGEPTISLEVSKRVGTNIIEMRHQREFGALSLKQTEMELVVEAKDKEHAMRLVTALEAAEFKVDYALTV